MSSNNNHAERNQEEWLPTISIIGQLQSNKPISDNETDRFMIADFSQFIKYAENVKFREPYYVIFNLIFIFLSLQVVEFNQKTLGIS